MSVQFEPITLNAFRQEFSSRKSYNKEKCTICLTSFGRIKEWNVVQVHAGLGPSRHPHHTDCLNSWFTQKKSCPCCNQEATLVAPKEEMLKIFKKVTLHVFGNGLLVGSFAMINNWLIASVPSTHTQLFSGNNTLITYGLYGGVIQSLLTYLQVPNSLLDGKRWKFTLLSATLVILFTLPDTRSIGLTSLVAAAFFASSAITSLLYSAGASWQGLAPGLLLGSILPTITSMMNVPTPALPIALAAALLGSVSELLIKK